MLYRKKEETRQILHDNDPLDRFEDSVTKATLMTKKECDDIRKECEEKIVKAKEYAVSCAYPDPSEFMKDIYVD